MAGDRPAAPSTHHHTGAPAHRQMQGQNRPASRSTMAYSNGAAAKNQAHDPSIPYVLAFQGENGVRTPLAGAEYQVPTTKRMIGPKL